jgi:cytochrome c
MKKVASVLVCFGFLFVFCLAISVAQERATKEECVAKCKEAAALIKEVGLEAAMPKLQDPKGQFVWKDSYVFVQDLEGKMLAHPMNPKLVGKSSIGLKDVNGKMFTTEISETAKNAGEGWVSYMWPKPNETTPSAKSTYILRVPGQEILVGSGIYDE